MFAPALAVVFAGIVNGDAGALDKQIKAVAHDIHLQPATIPNAKLRTLTHHGDGAREIVAHLHVDGLIAFEVVSGQPNPSLRIVIYDGDGGLKSLSDLPLGGRKLSKNALEGLRSNVEDDVRRLQHAPDDSDQIEMEAAPPQEHIASAPKAPPPQKHIAEPVPPPKRVAVATAPDAENPFGDSTPSAHVAVKVETADDSVSVDDIESMTGGGGADTIAVIANGATAPELRLQASLGFGLVARGFTPGPSTVAGYSSSPVGAVLLDANVQPTSRTSVGVVGETTVGMTSPIQKGFAGTTISRWEATASYTALRGVVDVAPLVGVGRRAFSIDSSDPSRTPDSNYNYLILGATASTSVGTRLLIRGMLAFEPVVSGTDPMEMTFGSASRWALDFGGAVEVRPRAHVFVRALVNYQRFAWSWDTAGARGAGGAVDGYPSGTLSLGAEY